MGSNPFGDPQTMALLGLSQGLLAAGSPHTMPIGLGGALAQGMGGAMNNAMLVQKMNQQQALVDLEKLKAQQIERQLGLQSWALGMSPSPITAPSTPVTPQGAPALANFLPTSLGASEAPQMPGMQPTQTAPAPATSGPLADLPPEAQRAIRLNIGLPGAGSIAWQASQPIIGREGGIYRRTPTGGMELDPAWLQGEAERLRLQKNIENQNTTIKIPLADGRAQEMTKADQLALLGVTNQISNAVPGLDPRAVANIQRQMLAEPDKSVDLNITLGGRPAKLTLPALRGSALPGMTTGPTATQASEQKARGEALAKVETGIDEDAKNAAEMRTKITELRGLLQDFNPSKSAPLRQTILDWKNAAPSWLFGGLGEKEMNEAGSLAGFGKIALGMAANSTRQLGAREAAQIFDKMQQANPSITMTPGGLDKVMGFMDATAQLALDKQSAKETWKQSHGDSLEGFEADWNRKFSGQIQSITKQAKELSAGGKQFPTPPQAAINRLRMNPRERDQFDEIFGAGAAAKVLGK